MQEILNFRRKLFGMPALAGLFLAVLVLFHSQTAEAATFMARGIDVSKWQGKVNWEQVKDDGIKFVMLGLGRYRNGKGYPDPYFKYNIEGALKQNIKVGVYLYSEATTVAQAKAEAKYVLGQIEGYKISYPVAFDIEDSSQQRLTTKQRTDITIAFLQIIEDAGYYPMIYASQNWFNTSMDLGRLEKYDKWVACWSSKVSFTPTSIWQYSSTGRVKGISGAVDLDVSYKDYSKLITPRALPVSKTGWQKDGKNMKYIQADGTALKNAFQETGKYTYYVDGSGNRVYGWKKINGKYYYFSSGKGIMQTGWKKIGGKYYYLDPVTGARKTGWLTLNGKKYYLNAKGVRQTGWVTVNGKKYYLSSNGVMKTGWVTVNSKKYYLNSKGVMQTGWLTLKGKKYYLSSSGVMKVGWLILDGKKYYLNSKGVLQTGWLTVNEKKYYLTPQGPCVKGWMRSAGKWYYFSSSGVLQVNKKIKEYEFDEDGVCLNYEEVRANKTAEQ